MFKTIFNFVLHAMAMEWGSTKIFKATQQIKIIIKNKKYYYLTNTSMFIYSDGKVKLVQQLADLW